MKVIVATSYEYAGKDTLPVESFELTVQGEFGDAPKKVAGTYLELRKKLKEGIKEEE